MRGDARLENTVKLGYNEQKYFFGSFRLFFMMIFPGYSDHNPVITNKFHQFKDKNIKYPN